MFPEARPLQYIINRLLNRERYAFTWAQHHKP